MLELEPATEEDMVLAFLRAELDSPRWGRQVAEGLARVGASRALIEVANLTSQRENAARVQVLDYRGYAKRRALFAGFPSLVPWYRGTLDANRLAHLRVLNQPDWVAYSGPGRLAVDASRCLGGTLEEGHVAAVAASLRAGRELPELIVVGTTEQDLVILEGHVRVMAALTVDPPPRLAALVGITSGMARWVFY